MDETVKVWDLIEVAYDTIKYHPEKRIESVRLWYQSSAGIIFTLWDMDAINYVMYRAIRTDLELIYKCRAREIERSEKDAPCGERIE